MKFKLAICATMFGAILLVTSGCVARKTYDATNRYNIELQEQRGKLEDDKKLLSKQLEDYKYQNNTIAKRIGLYKQKVELLLKADKSNKAIISQLTVLAADGMPQLALPEELNEALLEWAMTTEMVTYNEERGIVRFKSDLLFSPGQDTVQPDAQAALNSFGNIIKSTSADGFDILIVGHTDNVPVSKPATRAKHPTNWHLSAHRAIAVEKLLAHIGIAETRMVVLGMGEHRPIEPNQGKKGSARNRRVEIYIVPSGQFQAVEIDINDETGN